ncbi:MAG: chemotaxis protein CheR, partial [Desulfobulbaceae bacterium]
MAIKKKDSPSLAAPATTKASKKPRISAKTATREKPALKPSSPFPIVGIGASAGGLAAFEAFFSGMPANSDPGMAFILVQHLAPDHKSLLTDLIQRYTRMQVFEVEDGMAVQPNCAYIIPPARDMAFLNGTLQLLEPSAPRGQRLPIDFFFRSLAQDQHERAICIVLSGTGSDGTVGVQAIKAEGGMVMAQTPDTTEFDGMPSSAIGTGLVDYELSPADMPAQLMAYVDHAFRKPPLPADAATHQTENALKKIFILLRAHTGHDFSQYKLNTTNRRIARRMAVHQIETIEGYIKHLQQTPTEIESLFRELLIGVTRFFRDPEAFKVLEEQVIPRIFAEKPAGAVIRAWSTGCSTGEEAYSLAILLKEHLEILKKNYKVQVFATDIDNRAISTARAGLYPASIAEDLTQERLDRFFTTEPGGGAYRIHKSIRDMLIFSEQDVIKDPPFSKLDLISCRNLLIYIGSDLQKKLISLFHYALNPNGFLLLGTSETVGQGSELFVSLNRKAKLYQRKEDFHGAQHTALGQLLPPLNQTGVRYQQTIGQAVGTGKLSLRELTEQTLLQQVAPTGALVNSQGDVLYLHGRTGMYLEPPPGLTGINNILQMAREGLRQDLTMALHKAVRQKEIVHCTGLRVKTNGDYTQVNLTIRPVLTGPGATTEDPLYLIILEEVAPLKPPDGDNSPTSDGVDRLTSTVHIASLRQELLAKDEYLQTANEELKS